MRGFQYLVLHFALYVFFTVVTSPLVIAAVVAARYCDNHEAFRLVKWIFIPVVLGYVFGLRWVASQTAKRIAFENQAFGEAVKNTYYDARLRLAFLPVIGCWFESHTDERGAHQDDF